MSGMFYDCSSFSSINTSIYNREKVKDMSRMFEDCSKLTSLSISNFKTP